MIWVVHGVRGRMVVGFITNHNQCLEFSPDTPVSSINKTDRTEILLKVALSTIKTNIYDMARSHEGHDDKQHIFIPNFMSKR